MPLSGDQGYQSQLKCSQTLDKLSENEAEVRHILCLDLH